MDEDALRTAGIILVVYPTVVFGGVSILRYLVGRDPTYRDNPLRQRFWAAGHAHAGVLLALSLVALGLVGEADLGDGWAQFVRSSFPVSAILVPAAFFLSTAKPDVERPNRLIHLAWVGAAVLSAGMVVLGVGLLRAA